MSCLVAAVSGLRELAPGSATSTRSGPGIKDPSGCSAPQILQDAPAGRTGDGHLHRSLEYR